MMKAVNRKEKNWGEKKKEKEVVPAFYVIRGVACVGISASASGVRELHRNRRTGIPPPVPTLTAIQIFNDRTRSSRARTL